MLAAIDIHKAVTRHARSADKRRRGHLAKNGAPKPALAVVEAAQHASRKTSP